MNRFQNIPSLSALRALDLLDRLGTASAVAQDLGQTQGAISRQIKTLEQQLEVQLVRREKQRLYLTPQAKTYIEDVRSGLTKIETATRTLRSGRSGGTLTLGILPAFGMRWLMPKLSDFSSRHPEITLNMLTRLHPFDFTQEPIDAALHFGSPDWDHVSSLKLMSEYLVPVAAPTYVTTFDPNAVEKYTLLHMETRPTAWSDWIAKQGFSGKAPSGPVYDQFSTLMQAVLHGQGIALMPQYLVQEHLATGQMVQVFDGDGTTDKAYHLVWPTSDHLPEPVKVFRDWLATWSEGEDALPR